MNTKKKLDEYRTEITRAYQEDHALMSDIAKQYDVSVSTVGASLDRWGVKLEAVHHKSHYTLNANALDDESDPYVRATLEYLAKHGRIGKGVLIIMRPPAAMRELIDLQERLGTNKPPETVSGRLRLRIYNDQIIARLAAYLERQSA